MMQTALSSGAGWLWTHAAAGVLYRGGMRWTSLFADMELQFEAAERAGRAQEVADLTRAERAGTQMADLARGALGRPVVLDLRDGESVRGRLTDAGATWLLVSDQHREHLVPAASVVCADGFGSRVAPPPGTAVRRLGLGHALRAVARDRSVVRVVTPAGVLVGRIDAVGSDYLELALAHPDSRRPSGQRRVVAFTGLDLVSSL